MQRTLLSTVFSALIFVFPVVAHAQQAKEQPPAEASDVHLRGLEVMVRPTIGSVGGESPIIAKTNNPNEVPAAVRPGAKPYGISPGVGAQLGFRFHPLVSAGLRGDLNTVSIDAPNDGSQNLSRSRQSAGLYARAYPLALNEKLRQHIDPWVSAGVTYVHDGTSFQFAEKGITATYQVDSHSIGVPVGVGVDYRITKWLSTGPSFEYIFLNPVAGCLKGTAGGQEARVCTDDKDAKDGLVAQSIGAWNVGLTLRVTPF
jgi:hypothetical protein